MIEAERGLDLPVGWRLVAHDVLDSTNAEAKRLAVTDSVLEAGIVVQARVQTSGRGRRARVWDSPAGNLHFSVLLRPRVPKAQLALASFVAGVAVVEGVTEVAPALEKQLACKWPNDVLCGGRKLCGILLESEFMEGRPAWVVIGIGINVIRTPAAAMICYPVTSLIAEGVDVPISMVFSVVCHQLAVWLTRWQTEGFAPIRRRWLACAMGVGEPVMIKLDHSDIAGVFVDLDHDGALLVERIAGGRQRILAGDVFFQRKICPRIGESIPVIT